MLLLLLIFVYAANFYSRFGRVHRREFWGIAGAELVTDWKQTRQQHNWSWWMRICQVWPIHRIIYSRWADNSSSGNGSVVVVVVAAAAAAAALVISTFQQTRQFVSPCQWSRDPCSEFAAVVEWCDKLCICRQFLSSRDCPPGWLFFIVIYIVTDYCETLYFRSNFAVS